MDSAPEPSVIYVVSRWGEPTQTFVRREAAAVASDGCRVTVLSLKRPRQTELDIPVRRLGPVAVGVGLARALLCRPRACAHVVASVVRWSSPRNVPRQLVAACAGLAWAGAREVRADHLHAQFGWVAATAAWAASAASGVPYSVMLHAFELHSRRHVDRFTPIPLRAATQVFCGGARDRGILRDRWGIAAGVARMGVPRAWLEESGTERDPWLVVSVGSLRPKKGHSVLIDAISSADARWRLVICGEGPLREELEAQVADAGLQDRVRLVGAQSEEQVRAWLQRASVSCLASVETPTGDRDGIPIALMEALASGAAVVSTDVGGISELLTGAGVIVPSGDPAALAAVLDDLRDPSLRARLGAAGRQRVREEFVAEEAAVPVVELVRRSASHVPLSA